MSNTSFRVYDYVVNSLYKKQSDHFKISFLIQIQQIDPGNPHHTLIHHRSIYDLSLLC
jgi:hypothetical protein